MRRKFLWWPRCFEGRNVRWLEHADVVERVTKVDVGGSMEWGNYAWRWAEVGFVNQMPVELEGKCLEVMDEETIC